MSTGKTMAAGNNAGKVKRARVPRKRKSGTVIKARTVIAAVFLFSFFVFTIGVVGYVIFFGGVQA